MLIAAADDTSQCKSNPSAPYLSGCTGKAPSAQVRHILGSAIMYCFPSKRYVWSLGSAIMYCFPSSDMCGFCDAAP
eukprot:1162008-Pelagomonas_calceolata.AAC.4